jgi:hypothetical protein
MLIMDLTKVTLELRQNIKDSDRFFMFDLFIFNQGRLYNTAVRYLVDNFKSIDCIVLHDIDLIPMTHSGYLKEMGDYRCKLMPNHLSRKVFNLASNQLQFYNQFLTGGILSLRLGHFIDSNGFSNEYYGWGGEDGNLKRLKHF